jgi:hypothetical protein
LPSITTAWRFIAGLVATPDKSGLNVETGVEHSAVIDHRADNCNEMLRIGSGYREHSRFSSQPVRAGFSLHDPLISDITARPPVRAGKAARRAG